MWKGLNSYKVYAPLGLGTSGLSEDFPTSTYGCKTDGNEMLALYTQFRSERCLYLWEYVTMIY